MATKKKITYEDLTTKELFQAGADAAYKVKGPENHKAFLSGIQVMYEVFREMSSRAENNSRPKQACKLQALNDAMKQAINKSRTPKGKDASDFKQIIASQIINDPEKLAEIMISSKKSHEKAIEVNLPTCFAEHFARVALGKTAKSK